MIKKILVVFLVVLAVIVGVAFWLDIPRFVIGILTYGQQVREGTLAVGDPAPAVSVYEIDSDTPRPLSEWAGERPLVLVFGSFT